MKNADAERRLSRSAERLEGWKQAPCLWPSFETRACGALLRMTSRFY
jgi:hypothetical protein